MKRLLSTVLCLCMLVTSLCACGNENDMELSGAHNQYEIQISDTDYITISVPAECVLKLTDNYSHFEFEDGTVIDLANTQLTTAKYDEETGLYVGNSSLQLNIDDKCIIVSCTGSVKEDMMVQLQNVKRNSISTDLYKEYRIDALPPYKEVEMELHDNMYLPVNTPPRNWLSLESWLYTEGTNYLQLTVYDYPLKDIKTKLLTQLLCNTGQTHVDEWFQNDEILYMKAGNNYIVTKRLAFNCTYVYSCNAPLLDYALQGANKIYGTVGATTDKEAK